jgi:hypothetical protein
VSRFAVDVVLALLLVATFAAYARDSMVLILGSYHTGASGYCEVNPGIAVNRQLAEKLKWGFGAAQNSPCRLSLFTAIDRHLASAWGLKFGSRAGLATGYEDPVSAFAGLTITKPQPEADYTVTVVPKRHPVFIFNVEFPIRW